MNALPQTTQRRLKKLPQTPSIWEGDRRSMSGMGTEQRPGECIVWVDGSEGFVRALDVVSPNMGLEAVVRTLLRAIENPDSPAQPARPRRIVVRDREIQFFLRGALQSLEIDIEYVPQLPLIDELFSRFEEVQPLTISTRYESLLEQAAHEIWHHAPWEAIADHDILAIELNQWDVSTIYACVMGMLGREYGVILYRSLDSIRQFREAVLSEESVEGLEKAFLGQDCWFLNFELKEDRRLEPEDELDLADFPLSDIRCLFGSIHPYEGMRPLRDEEEAGVIYATLKALGRFFQTSKRELTLDLDVSKHYSISVPSEATDSQISVQVSTLPEVTTELLTMMDTADEDEEVNVPLREDLVPENALLSLSLLPWELVNALRDRPSTHVESLSVLLEASGGEGLPVVLIQTSRPKAKAIIEKLSTAGGLKAICLNPGEDPFTDLTYDVGIVQTGNGDLYLFGEFINDTQHLKARQRWTQRCQQTNGYCGLVVAMGATGSSRGKPQHRDLLALFETEVLEAEELGMGMLQLLDWE